MKKILSVLLALAVLLSLAACSEQENKPSESSELTQSAPQNKDESNSTPTGNSQSKILIAYFSRYGNTNYSDEVDASTSASIVINGERFGTTEYMARLIQKNVGGDLFPIKTVTPYTDDFDELRDVNHNEQADGVLPKLQDSDLDMTAYDTVFIGYPVWATDVPQAVLSFINQYDLSGKTVIPFCTHDGYGAGSSYDTVRTASKVAQSPDGLAIEAKDISSSASTVENWLKDIGVMTEKTNSTQTPITIQIGDNTLDGVLYDTALANEIKAYFPLTVSMVGYAGREYYGGVDFYPENLEGGQKTFENGDITYCEAHHNMAIFYAQTDNPNLSVDVIPIGKVTSDLSVFNKLNGAETVVFSIKNKGVINYEKDSINFACSYYCNIDNPIIDLCDEYGFGRINRCDFYR